jgi:hypothetical protein
MASLPERMAAFVRRYFPDAHCDSCLATRLHATETEVRDPLQASCSVGRAGG